MNSKQRFGRRLAAPAAAVAIAFGLVGCAAPGVQNSRPASAPYGTPSGQYGTPSGQYGTTSNNQYGTRYGQVQSVEMVRGQQQSGGLGGSGAGAAIGAVIGGVLGNQVGGGTGRAVATGAGAIGGAIAGDRIEASRSGAGGANDIQRVLVRFDDGSTQYFDYAQQVDFRAGDRVRVDNGRLTRY